MSTVNLGPAAQIPLGEGREYTVNARVLSVFRSRNGAVYATQAACPHRGGPLCEGLLGETTIVCPLHGLAFDVATGAPVGAGNTCAGLRTYATKVDERGDVLVAVPPEEP
jgi:nitrite reductase (NADH) small subunit